MREFNPELLEFDLSKWEDPLDQSNAVLEFIVNRAYKEFLASGKAYIVVENYSGDMQDFAAFQIASIVSTFTTKPIYVRKQGFNKLKWMKKLNSHVQLVGAKAIDAVKEKGFIISVFSADQDSSYKHLDDDYTHIDHYIFEGVDLNFIKTFTTGFWGYNVDCPENRP